ncbi:MAG: alanine--tRNA ligase [Candidatus Methylomirabilales bacterium]
MGVGPQTGGDLRRLFLQFFARHDHVIVPSSPLTPLADPTLLFTNAGMVQFKDVFLGRERRDYLRATSCQKCLRAGGKHNDLENVGQTARHHTFFEMLGNFSFGDYFKDRAIAYAWEFLTKEVGLPQEKLWVTIYQDDDQAFELWQRIAGVSPDRIIRLGEQDNFWAMGDTGPCGPCSEIVIDQGPGPWACGQPTCRVGCNCDRFLELWNLVFMQFVRDESGTLSPLPRPSIDTGAGLERLAAVLQQVPSNFDTDLLRPLIAQVEELSGRPYGHSPRDDISMRVIADHARATAFLITDGVFPGNEGRGYVLRRIMRRAFRHGRLLGLEGPFLSRITAEVTTVMREAYPELLAMQERATREIIAEEERFGHTLRMAIPRLEAEIQEAKAGHPDGARLTGEQLFKLYDTYGLPRDIIEEIASEQDVTCDWTGFEAGMAGQRQRARVSGTAFKLADVPAAFRGIVTDRPTRFHGYEEEALDAEIVAIAQGGKPVRTALEGEEADLILDQTPFYAEGGGQIADTGHLEGAEGRADVLDVQKPVPELFVHRIRVRRGRFTVGDRVRAAIDAGRRAIIVKNHTGTHLLHEALHRVLGDHVRQEGSLVAPDRLRFDFRHFGPVTAEELGRIERLVNEQIWRNPSVTIEEGVPFEEALQRKARAFFADKYGDRVRVVAIPGFGAELCGGTHTRAVGEIGIFRIVGEGGVAAGIRRIEAYTGPGAYDHLRQEGEALRVAAEVLKTKPFELPERVGRLSGAARGLEREVDQLRARLASRLADELLNQAERVEGIRLVRGRVENLDQRALRDLADRLRTKIGSGVIVLGAIEDGKVNWVAGVTSDLTGQIHAGRLIKEVAKITEGGGGGRPDLAEAGGKAPSKIDQALHDVPLLLRRVLKAGVGRT